MATPISPGDTATELPPFSTRKININLPPDVPLVPVGLEGEGVDGSPFSDYPDQFKGRLIDSIPAETRREVLGHIIKANSYEQDVRSMTITFQDCSLHVFIQSFWMMVSIYVSTAGYRRCDYLASPAQVLTTNKYVNKLANPITIIGVIMGGVTCYQLPGDITLLKEAYELRKQSEAKRDAELALCYKLNSDVAEHVRKRMEKKVADNTNSFGFLSIPKKKQ